MGILREAAGPVPVAFGGGALSGSGGGYGFGDVGLQDSLDALRYAFERGVRVFDTAPIYGHGESERRIGRAFRGKDRDGVLIVSKCGVTWDADGKVRMTNDPGTARAMLEQSLRDLGTDRIDLYMVHWPDPAIDIRRPVEALAELKAQGKIRHIGLCNTTVGDLAKAAQVARVEAVQSEFHFFEPQSGELFGHLERHGVDFFSWGTLDKGILTGTVTRERTFDASDCRSRSPWWLNSDKDRKMDFMRDRVFPLLERRGVTGLAFALGWNLSHPGVPLCLCGGRTVAQWKGILDALDALPGEDVLEECRRVRKEWGADRGADAGA